MHDTALALGGLFFSHYVSLNARVLDIGVQAADGSLRQFALPSMKYVGVGRAPGNGVDFVLDDLRKLPFEDEAFDAVVSTSYYEHDPMFWVSFLETVRVTAPGGYIYVNVPSNGDYHRLPTDSWRFYPDAGSSLAKWARKEGFDLALVESFIGPRSMDMWNDCVMVFERAPLKSDRPVMADKVNGATNIRRHEEAQNIENFSLKTFDHKLLLDAAEALQIHERVSKEAADLLSELQVRHEKDEAFIRELQSKPTFHIGDRLVDDTRTLPESRVKLQDVTICVADCLHPSLAARALAISMSMCDFGDAVLFSDLHIGGAFRTVSVPRMRSRHDYSDFMLRRLVSEISTEFVLVVQWDGYIVDPTVWLNVFRNYDYIGAKWPWRSGRRVGNGGFSWRSSRLLRAVSDIAPATSKLPEDEVICLQLGETLERDHGIRFAPESLADRFAYERATPNGPTFGFHGLFNMWRHVEDGEMLAIVRSMDASVTTTREYIECLMSYFVQRRFGPLNAMYVRLRARMSREGVQSLLSQHVSRQTLVAECVEVAENMLDQRDRDSWHLPAGETGDASGSALAIPSVAPRG